MPINYKEYHTKWKLISWLIRIRRAKNKCEKCGIGNYQVKRFLKSGDIEISNYKSDQPNYTAACIHAQILNNINPDGLGKWSVIVLTVAHLDHDKENNRFNNLAALCQRCHLQHDIRHHAANRKYGRHHKSKHQLKIQL